MAEKKEPEVKIVPIRGAVSSKVKMRPSLASFFTNDTEYRDLGTLITPIASVEDTLDAEVADETKVTSVSNVMNLIYLDIKGVSGSVIARDLGVDVKDIRKIRASNAYITARGLILQQVLDQSKRIMEVSALKAVKTLTECMNSANDKVKLAAATEVLDRVGLKGTQQVEITGNLSGMEKFTDEQLAEILGKVLPEADYSIIDDDDEDEEEDEDATTENYNDEASECPN